MMEFTASGEHLMQAAITAMLRAFFYCVYMHTYVGAWCALEADLLHI